ncbi:acetolactate synthase small subunit, partial [Bacillus sp. D-CC]
MKRIVTATVRNQSGVLNRITGVMTRRHFNIESISVGHTESSDISRMTIVVHVENEQQVEQLIKQLHKQIDVLKVSDITAARNGSIKLYNSALATEVATL